MDKVKIWAPKRSGRRIGISAFGVVFAVIGTLLLTLSRAATSCTGVTIAPGADIQAAANANPTGTTFCFEAGTYRMLGDPVEPKSDQKFIGKTDASGNRLSFLTGAKVLTGAVKEGSYWVYGGQTQQFTPSGTGCQPASYTGCGYPEGVFINNVYLYQEMSQAAVGAGEFYFDYAADKIYIADDPTGKTVEASVGKGAFTGFTDANYNVQVKDFIIEKFTTPGLSGNEVAAIKPGTGYVIENNEVRFNHNTGIQVGKTTTVRGNYIHHNGQYGMSGGVYNGSLIENNEISYNNLNQVDNNWDAGGTKFVKATDMVIRGNYIHHNDGPGLWCDGNCVRITYENNFIEYNAHIGIFHEISYDAIIRNNVVRYNGLKYTGQSIWYGADIFLGTSQNVEIYGNKIQEDKDYNGIVVVSTDRSGSGAPCCGTYIGQNNNIHDNTVILSTGGQSGSTALYVTNKWQNNTYYLGDPPGVNFVWDLGKTVTQWNALGQDTTGTFNALSLAPAPEASPQSMAPPTVDTTNPTVSLTGPVAGATINGNTTMSASGSDNIGVTKVEFFYGTTKVGEATSSPYSVVWDTAVVTNGSYSLTAKAWDAASNSALSAAVSVTVNNAAPPTADTQAPTVPTNLIAAAPAYNSVNLSWTASTDNVGVAGYYIVRGGVTIANKTGPGTTYADATVNASTPYKYQVIAYDAAMNPSALSSEASVVTSAAPDTTKPTAPTNLTATAVSSSQINLSWTASTDNIGVKSYDVYRNGSRVATNVTTVSYGDTGLAASTPYDYSLKAVDAAGNVSDPSATVRQTTQGPPVTVGTITGIVSDPAGVPLANAKVVITVNGAKKTYSTTSAGTYTIPSLNPGTYSITYSESSRFVTQTASATVAAGTTTTKNITLQRK